MDRGKEEELRQTIQRLEAKIEALECLVDALNKQDIDLLYKWVELLKNGQDRQDKYFDETQEWNERQIKELKKVQAVQSDRLRIHFRMITDVYDKLIEHVQLWRRDRCGREDRAALLKPDDTENESGSSPDPKATSH